MTQEKYGHEFIKKLLNNFTLLKWVKKFSADGLQSRDISKKFNVKSEDDSISISDANGVKIFFSSAKFDGKVYTIFDIKQIKEVLAMVGDKGNLIIGDSKDKRLCYVEDGENIIVVAPVSEEQVAEEEKEEVAEEKPKTD